MVNITFIGDYFALTTAVVSPPEYDEETVIEQAASLLFGYYGWDVRGASHDIEVNL